MTRLTAVLTIALAVLAIAALIIWGRPASRNGLEPNTPNTAWLQDFATGELEKLAVTMPPEALPVEPFADGDGKPVSFKDFRGKVLLINFWATWCAPCKVEMPALDRLAGELGGKDFAAVTISIDRGGAPVAGAFLEEIDAQNLTLYVDPSSTVARALRVQGLPVTILADADGREIARYLGPAEWDGEEAKALVSEAIRRSR